MPFFQKPVTPSRVIVVGAEQFHRNGLLNFTVCPLAEINRAHTASAEQTNQLIWPAFVDFAASGGIEQFLRSPGNTFGQVETVW